jgi:hypothetical protein
MKVRRLVDEASFGPETVKAMGQAFDEASSRIARIFDPDQVESARRRLAIAMISVATEGSTDVAALKADALDAMARHSRLRR